MRSRGKDNGGEANSQTPRAKPGAGKAGNLSTILEVVNRPDVGIRVFFHNVRCQVATLLEATASVAGYGLDSEPSRDTSVGGLASENHCAPLGDQVHAGSDAPDQIATDPLLSGGQTVAFWHQVDYT